MLATYTVVRFDLKLRNITSVAVLFYRRILLSWPFVSLVPTNCVRLKRAVVDCDFFAQKCATFNRKVLNGTVEIQNIFSRITSFSFEIYFCEIFDC